MVPDSNSRAEAEVAAAAAVIMTGVICHRAAVVAITNVVTCHQVAVHNLVVETEAAMVIQNNKAHVVTGIRIQVEVKATPEDVTSVTGDFIHPSFQDLNACANESKNKFKNDKEHDDYDGQ